MPDWLNLVLFALLAVYVLSVLANLFRRGVISSKAFADAPRRAGEMGLHDLAFGLGVTLLGAVVAAQSAAAWLGPPDPEAIDPMDMLRRMLVLQAGMLPGVGYLLLRAEQAMPDGSRGLGFRLDRPGPAAMTTLRVTLFIIPATFLTLALAGLISMQLGYEIPPIAHQTLVAILEAESPIVRFGLIGLAVGLVPVLEEIIFRGLVQTALLQSKAVRGRWTIIAVASLLFTLMHVGLPAPALVGIYVLSLGLGYAYEKTGRLWAPMLIHIAFNALNVAAVVAGLFDGEAPAPPTPAG